MILSIDASFTSTGVSLHQNDGTFVDCLAVHEGGSVYKSNSDLHKSCSKIANSILQFVEDKVIDDNLTVIIEIPAPNTSGFYLAMLHGWLVSVFKVHKKVMRIVTMPCGACNSYSKNKSKTKTHIVKFAKESGFIPNKRINNDIATAAILTHCYLAYLKGSYKNTVNVWDL